MDGACDNMTRGVDGADGICESRYTEDVASEHRTTIMERHETGALGHKALLASSGGDSNLPQNFDINGKDSYPIRRPDSDSTQIAPSWADFFNGAKDLENTVSGTEDIYWTGLEWNSADRNFNLATPPSGSIATRTCVDWSTSNDAGSRDGLMPLDPTPINEGAIGRGSESETGFNRIWYGAQRCGSSSRLLCITH